VVVQDIKTTDGVIIIDLEVGKYSLHEVKAPRGYEELTQPIDFTIEENKSTMVEIEVENVKLPVCNVFDIEATDEAGKGIASIVVKDENGDEVASSETDSITLNSATVP